MRIACFSACGFCLFIMPAISANLPSGYTELEYLQSSGTQYIDSGFTPNQDSRFKMKALVSSISAGDATFGGAYDNQSFSGQSFGFYGGWSSGKLYSNYNDEVNSGKVVTINVIHTLDLNKNKFYYDGELVSSHNISTFSSLYTIKIGHMYISSAQNKDRYFKGNIYEAQMWDNGTLVRNMVPAKRKSDGVLGMYDTAWDGSQYGVVDFGNLGWYKLEDGIFVVSLADANTTSVKLYQDKYSYIGMAEDATMAAGADKSFGYALYLGKVQIKIKDTNYTDATSLKNSLKGVKLYYQRTTDSEFHGPFYTNAGTGVFIGGPEVGIKVATTKYVEEQFADSVNELNTTMGTIKNVVDNTIIQADRIGKLHTGKQNRPAENCPDGAQCLLITEADGSLHWYPICDENGNI